MNVIFDQIAKGAKARASAAAAAVRPVRLCVLVSHDCDRDLARSVKEALKPRTGTCRLYVAGYGGRLGMPAVHAMGEAAVMVEGGDPAETAELYRAYRSRGVPCLVLAGLDTDRERVRELVAREVEPGDVVLCAYDRVSSVVAGWLLEAIPQAEAALGAGFACCQAVLARRIMMETARANALVGALTFLKGADTPVMMANEVAMVYRLAVRNGLPLGRDRLPELASVLGASVGGKALARIALAALPVPAPFVKAGVAALGTYAVGLFVNNRQQAAAGKTATGEEQA